MEPPCSPAELAEADLRQLGRSEPPHEGASAQLLGSLSKEDLPEELLQEIYFSVAQAPIPELCLEERLCAQGSNVSVPAKMEGWAKVRGEGLPAVGGTKGTMMDPRPYSQPLLDSKASGIDADD